jgi:hypothetical protein
VLGIDSTISTTRWSSSGAGGYSRSGDGGRSGVGNVDRQIGLEPIGYRRNYLDRTPASSGAPNTSFRFGYSRYAADTHFRVYENVMRTRSVGPTSSGTSIVPSIYERSQRRDHLEPLALIRSGAAR